MKKATAKNTKPAKPSAKIPAVKPTLTTISAQIDAGFGNTLYIRGDGPGLSWEKGIAMDCVAGDKWVVTLSDATTAVTFKLLLHDVTWCGGDDYVVAPGESVAVVPSFHGAAGAAGTISPIGPLS